MNQQYTDQTIRRIVYLESLKQSEVNKLSPRIKAIDALIKGLLIGDELVDLTVKDFNVLLEKVRQGVKAEITKFTNDLNETLVDVAVDTYEYESKSIDNAFDKVDLVVLAAAALLLKRKMIDKLVKLTPLSVKGAEGKTITDIFNDLANNNANKYVNHIKLARYQGKTNQQIAVMLRGTRKNGYKDGLMEVTSRQAKTIVKTTVQHSVMQGKSAFIADNQDVIAGERIIVILDSRTSPICRYEGHVKRLYKIGEGDRPPLHWDCRSTTVIVLKSGLGGGDVDQNEPYYSWLSRQHPDFQNDVLGKTKGELFRSGGLSADKFAQLQLDKNFKPLTLKEMREREPLAFKKAGL